jgi:hypothetical protein
MRGIFRALGGKSRIGVWLGSLLVAVVFVSGAWVTTFWALGFATALVGALCLAVASWITLPDAVTGRLAAVATLAVVAVAAFHTWSLVVPPLVGLGVLLTVRLLRDKPGSRDLIVLSICLALSAVLCFPLAFSRTGNASASELLRTPGASGLSRPGIWWLLALVAAILVTVVLWRRMVRVWPGSWITMMLSGLATIAMVWFISHSTWAAPTYYVLKMTWMLSVLVLPVAVGGAMWISAVLVKRAWSGPWRRFRLPLFAVAAAVLVLSGAALAGQVVGGGWRPAKLWNPRVAPNYQALITIALEGSVGRGQEPDGVLVWGISPMLQFPQFPDYAQARQLDQLSLESIAWFWPGRLNRSVGPRNEQEACDYLREHPNALRVTGPAPESGPNWLIDSGCPAAVVRADDWIRIPMLPDWINGVWDGPGQPSHMTYSELKGHRAEVEDK